MIIIIPNVMSKLEPKSIKADRLSNKLDVSYPSKAKLGFSSKLS